MDQSGDCIRGDKGNIDLQSLLSQEPIKSWKPIYRRIQNHPHETQHRNYRNESCLQIALRAAEHIRWRDINDTPWDLEGACEQTDISTGKQSKINRLDVLKAILSINPTAIHWRDDEGRTPLHTACSAGRSFDILQWLLDEEESNRLQRMKGRSEESGSPSEGNATLRTDFPGGALALHSIAACPVFDDMCSRTSEEARPVIDDSVYSRCLEKFQSCQVPVHLTPNILSAFASTTTLIQANPKAVWDKDCEGEIPLHLAASYGNIGSVLALLIAAEHEQPVSYDSTYYKDKKSSPTSVSFAVLALNDRQQNPLHCACERVVAFCVRGIETVRKSRTASAGSNQNSYRVSISREDPFEDWAADRSRDSCLVNRNLNRNMNEDRGSSLRTSLIRGCGISLRSSLSTSCVLSGGLFGLDDVRSNSDALRVSFTSPRRPVHPVFGLEAFDEDGDEEFAKVELLTRAACGCFHSDNIHDSRLSDISTDTFHLVHELISLDQPPEVIWHAARKNPLDVTIKDDAGRVPLFLACERLVSVIAENEMNKPKYDSTRGSVADSVDEELENSTAARSIEESVPIGSLPISATRDKETLSDEGDHNAPPRTQPLSSAPRHQVSFAIEIINMLLYSPAFGSREMASVPNNEGRLPLHILLEAVQWTDDGDEEENDLDDNDSFSLNQSKIERRNPIRSLIDAYPRALESRDCMTGLYPFMLAAAFSSTDKLTMREDDGENCLLTVETVYRLLVTSPTVISLCLKH